MAFQRLSIIAAFVLGTSLVASKPAEAFLGFNAGLGGGVWSQNLSGSINSTSGGQNSSLELKNDLGLKNKTQGYLWFQFEQPLPLIPDIRLEYSHVDVSGTQTLSRSVTFSGQTYAANVPLNSSLKLTQGDVILYYQPLATILHIRLGVDIKALHFKALLGNASTSSTASGSFAVPMLYAGLGVHLPLTGLSASVDGSYVTSGSSNLSDYKLRLAYQTASGLGIEGGYREMALKIDNSSLALNGNIHIKGAYLGLFYNF